MIQGTEEKVRCPPPNVRIYISSEPVFKGDSESKKGIFISDLQLLLWLFQISNPKIGFDETGFKQDVLYIIWPQILRRFRIYSKIVAVSIVIAIFVLNCSTKY